MVVVVLEVERLVVCSRERRGLLRGTTERARALKASATRLGWLLTKLFHPLLSITSDAFLQTQTAKCSNIEGEILRNLQIKDTLGPAILSFVERLSSPQRLKMNYCYRKGVQKSGRLSLSRRVLDQRLHSAT